MTTSLHGVTKPRGATSRFLVDVAQRVGASLELGSTLQQITDAVVELLGFEVATVSLLTVGDELEVVQVAGPAQELVGTRDRLEAWEQLLALGRPHGTLRFVPHSAPWPAGKSRWIPDLPVSQDPQGWQPGDALVAPLHAHDGTLLGMLSVDCPTSGRRPTANQYQLLDLFALHSALALDHARIYAGLRHRERLMRRTFQNAPIGMAVFGPDRRLIRANAAFAEFLGRPAEDLVGLRARDFTHPEDVALTDEMTDNALISTDTTRIVKRYVHADGHTIWGRLTLTSAPSGDGETHLLAQVEDYTAARQVARDLERRANTDHLTGLDNRASVLENLQGALHTFPSTAVLFCDVDRLKTVNDRLGHSAGDDLLVETAQVLRSVLRPGDWAARLGGDEFVVVLCDVTADSALEIAERIRKASHRMVDLDQGTVETSITVGVALGAKGATAVSVVAAADRALLQAKRDGRDRVVLG